MNKLIVFLLLFSFGSLALAADGFSTFEERMTMQEFTDSGLDKLTPDELANLNDWARRHSVATLENSTAGAGTNPAIAGESRDMRGFANQPKDTSRGKVIDSTIAGTFEGWTGKNTVFKLTNGMAWQQDEKDTFSAEPVENAQVTIKKSMMGNWHMSLVGYNRKVQVIRIQ